ncbi:MAG: DUF4493 domain-containing protein [Bacteroidales bacterium]|nr:DUF4493 domain-containing protein [Bacteroidales bacterium]
MKTFHQWEALGFALMLISCQAQNEPRDLSGPEGGIRISLSQADIDIRTKAEDPDAPLPSLDDFDVEVYNSNAIRLYRKYYSEAKEETIKLNAGDYRLVAQHGDSLGAGFGKPYYLADQAFTVHGYVDNGGEPDYVNATARLANVRLAVTYGEKIRQFYSNYYVVVRHSSYSKKQVKFTKDETRLGYIPGGNLYLEVYAYLGGTSDKAGEDRWVYYKSEPASYLPNDFVTFKVDAPGREGDLSVTINVDRSVETIEIEEILGPEALPAAAPSFSFSGDVSGTYTYDYIAGFVDSVSDAVLSLDISPSVQFKSVLLHTESGTINLEDTDLAAPTDAQKQALEGYGISWLLPEDYPMGYVNFNGAVKYLSDNAPFTADTPTATFTVTVTDTENNSASATFALQPTPVDATITVADTDIWGWKFVSPKAVLKGASRIPDGTVIGLQYSKDGSTWSSEIASVAVDGINLTFADATGLTAGTSYQLRTIVNHDATNVSSSSSVKTEDGAQVGNSGFEEYTTKTNVTPVTILSDFTTTWWQLYSSESDKWWAVSSLNRIPSGSVAAGYHDYKSYPSVALTTSGAYSGNSVMVATIFIGSAASKIVSGDGKLGELFIGTANDQQGDSWSKSSEGHAFTSRPSHLSFQYKFTRGGSEKNFDVSIRLLAADGSVIGTGSLLSSTEKGSWTLAKVPVTYTVTNKKAASIRMSFKSSVDGNESCKSVTGTDVTTLSGSHDIHAGNILYLDNIELLYQ